MPLFLLNLSNKVMRSVYRGYRIEGSKPRKVTREGQTFYEYRGVWILRNKAINNNEKGAYSCKIGIEETLFCQLTEALKAIDKHLKNK